MGEGKGAGRSRYNGLRLTLTVLPSQGRGFLTVTRKNWRDGWDTWVAIAPMRRLDTVSVSSDLEALETMYEALGRLVDEARAGE